MKFKVGFLLGAAAGAWLANKASDLQHGDGRPATSPAVAADEAAAKLKALSGLARERLTDLIEGPIGTMARDRLTEAIGSSLSGARPGSSRTERSYRDDAIDAKAS